MSVSMILKLVDQFSGPAKNAETAAEKFKREMDALHTIRTTGTTKDLWDKATFDRASQGLVRRREEMLATQKAEMEAARAVEAAERAKAESAAAAANEIVAANERVVASEQRTVAAIERSAREQAAAQAGLQRQRSAAYVKAERDREAAAARERREQARIEREQRHHGAGALMLGGAASAVSAHSIWHMGEETIKAGAERQHVEVKALNAGIPASEIARIQKAAIEAKRGAPNMGVTEIEELFTEARSAVKHPEETFHIINDLARAGSVLKGMGVDNSGLALIVKAAESLGRMNSPEQFKAYLDGQVKAMQVFGKTITPEQIYEAAKYSKSAGGTLSDHFINATMPSLIQELRGSSAGDALSMMVKTLRGGLEHRGTASQLLSDIGLFADDGKIHRNKAGKVTGYGGKLKGDDLLATNPDRWVWEVFKPAMQANGIKSLEDQIAFANKALPGTAANLVSKLLQQEEAIKQHQRNLEAAADAEQAAANQAQEAASSFTALTKSLNDLSAATSRGAMPAIAAGLNKITSGINALAEAASKHPIAAAGIGAGLGAGALAGSGYLAYQLYKGFGLSVAATQLTGAAAALDAAAGKLALSSGLPTKGPLPKGAAPLGALGGLPLWTTLAALAGIPIIAAAGAANREMLGSVPGNKGENAIPFPSPTDKPWFGPGGKPGTVGLPLPTPENLASATQALQEVQQRGQSAIQTLQMLNGEQVTPNVDASQLDLAVTKGNEAHSVLQQINGTFSPKIDTASFDVAIEKAMKLKQVLGGLGPGGGGHSFSPSSGALHDGPEHR
ncbi:hypothetical protein CCR94_16230 [Rhodoblastus sphagnicola]|uniref:Phage tail tape measure protein domain-containing protein n=2 Tax=Rhodoblastus sphagnicola TaxID=333368 RepID=A0A2S6N2W3_9HYPH|nr:hypothetical protein CCR94_16230 [Rhodoblastus sphagnicola]